MQKKINFRQLKYVAPAIGFPFVLFIGYQVFNAMQISEDIDNQVVETTEFNSSLPEISVDKEGIKNKFQAMLDNYGNVQDRTAVGELEDEVEQGVRVDGVYSEAERRSIDSIAAAREAGVNRLQAQAEALRKGDVNRSMAPVSREELAAAGAAAAARGDDAADGAVGYPNGVSAGGAGYAGDYPGAGYPGGYPVAGGAPSAGGGAAGSDPGAAAGSGSGAPAGLPAGVPADGPSAARTGGYASDGEARVNVPDERYRDNPDTYGSAGYGDETADPAFDKMIRQMQMIQRMASGERILTDQEKAAAERKAELERQRQELLDSIARANRPSRVNKAEDAGEQYFNSVQDREERPGMIKARVDEMVKVKDGSRLRLRISEDAEIDGAILPRGSYLYAIVSGFSAQRVKAQVLSVMLEGRIRSVDLSVYDVDGMEGFFVPESSFREFTREVGGQAAGSLNVNMNTSGEQNLQSIAMQTLQQAFQSTTSALAKKIRQNKAKIKYNTVVYLVNGDEVK